MPPSRGWGALWLACLLLLVALPPFQDCPAACHGGPLAPCRWHRPSETRAVSWPRREILAGLAGSVAVLPATTLQAADLTTGGGGLRAKLQKRDALELTAPIFNIPPRRQVYPEWLEGTWLANQTFAGFAFPTLPRQTVMAEEDVPGFKTCSIIDFADVGRSEVHYKLRWERLEGSVVEDVNFNLPSTVSAHLNGKGKVTSVQYLPDQDPNRLTILVDGSRNAERVELFVNSRISEAPEADPDLFLASEYRRQVTFSSRVVQGYNGNYQHFKTFRHLGKDRVRLNVLTASYIDALNPLYFQTIDKPVIVFSHEIMLSRAES